MASMTMASSFLGGCAAITATKQPSTTARAGGRGLVVMSNASKNIEKVVVKDESKGEGKNMNGRRDMMFAVVAAAAMSAANVVSADEEPKRGTEAAKKKYAPICVTMPTARICRN